MARGGLVGTSKTDNRFAKQGAGLRLLALAIAGAAGIGLGVTQAGAATTYAFNSFTAGTYDWSTGANWTATGTANAVNFPGGDATVLDDIANISFNAAGPTGAVIVNLSSPPPAPTLGSLTLSLMSGTAADTLTLNLNTSLSVTGNVGAVGGTSSGNKNGKVNLNVATGTTLTVGGTLSTSGSDGNGAAGITINGNLVSTTTQVKDDGDNFTVGTNAGSVNLGNFTLLRSASSSISTSSPGLHLNGGIVSATGFTIGSGNSSGVAVVADANLTISGSFIVGDPQSGTANTSRPNTLFQTSGTVTATASSGLSLGAATTASGTAIASAGTYALSGGTLNVPMLQMTGSGTSSPSTNKANFTLTGTGTLNVGSGGIVLGTGSAAFSTTGGTLAATGSWTNAYTGSIAINTGTTTFQAGDASGNPFDMAFAGSITGGGILAKTGGGNLTLSGSSSYSGGTLINAGTLYVNNPANSGTGSGFVHVVGGTLGGHGIISGIAGVDVGSAAHVAPGVNNVGTLTISTLTLEAGSTADFDFNSAANSMITITSALALNGGGIDLYQEGTTLPFTANGTYNLFNFTGAATIPGNYGSLQILNSQGGVIYTLGTTATAITVTISGGTGGAAGWTVDADGSWGNAANWAGNAIPGAGGVASFGSEITSPHTVTLDGNRSVAGVVFNNTNAYTLAAGVAGSTLTLDAGTGNATLSDLSGSHSITAPVVLNSSTSITVTNVTDTLTLAGGISGGGNLTVNGFGILLLTGPSTYTGTTTIPSGTVTIGNGGSLGTGNITSSGSLLFTAAGNVSVTANISGTGTITQSGAGVLNLSGANSYTGSTILTGGSIQLGSSTALGAAFINFSGPGTVDLNGNALTLGSITGAGTFDNTLATGNATLIFNGAATFNGVIENTAGSLALVKSGSGNLTLGGTNTYSGGTTITSGAIKITTSSALGTGPIAVNAATGLILTNGIVLTNNIVNGIPSTEFEDLPDAGATATLAGNITSLPSDQYRLGVSGNGTLTLTGASSAQTTSVLTRGNIVYAGNGSLAITTPSNANASLIIGRTSGATLNLTIQDNASVSSNNGITLDGNASASDATNTNIILNGNGILSSSGGAINLNNSNASAANVTLSLNGSSKIIAPGFLSSKSTPVVMNLNGGSIVANAGDPAASFFLPVLGNVSAKVLAGGFTINDGGFAITIAQPLLNGTGGTTDGGLTKIGNGSLTLSGASTYTGGTTLNGGTLLVTNVAGSATGSGNVTLNTGTLGGSGFIAGSITPGSAAHTLNPGAPATVGILTVGGLATNANTTLAFDLTSPAGANDLLAVTTLVHLGGGTLAIASQATTGAASLGYYKVLSYGTLTGSIAGIALPAVTNNVAYTLDTAQDPGFIDIHRGYIGDANDDGKVDLSDLNVVLNNLGTANSSWSKGNFDGAASIDLTDLNDVLNHLGTSIASGSAIAAAAAPEPASLGLLAFGAAALLTRRRKA